MKTTYFVNLYDNNNETIYKLEFIRPVCKDYFKSILEATRKDYFKPLNDKRFMELYGIKSFEKLQVDHSEFFNVSFFVGGNNR